MTIPPLKDREVVIFRHNLFKVSETFITQQAQALQRYRPLYLGRLRFGDAPAQAFSLAIEDFGGRLKLPRIAWQMVSRNTRDYRRLLANHGPALIHAHFGIEGVYALPLARALNIPLITTFHGFDATLSTAGMLASPAWANYPIFRRRLARQGNLFLCASSFIRERVLAMGFPEKRTRVHFIGVDCQAIQPRDAAEEMPVILHVARLVEVKGAVYLLRAFAQLAHTRPDIRLVLIGDGPLKSTLIELAQSLDIISRIDLLGALPHAQVLAWMRKAAMVALPSIRTGSGRVEGLGMALLEAAATGVPAIGSCLGGIPEAVINGKTGFLVPERDAGALANRMAALLDDGALRRRMGEAARAMVEARFDLRRQTVLLESAYDSVLGRTGQ